MRFGFFAFAFLSACIACASCAVEEDSAPNEDEKVYLDAWLKTHHPDAEPVGMGVYVLETTAGTGENTVHLPCYARVTYTITDLEGNVSNTSDSTVAKRTGSFVKSNYYGPRVWTVAENAIFKGVEDMLMGLPEGSTRKAVIPGWLQTNYRYGTEEEYMTEITDNSPLIYEVKINEITDDMMQWQKDRMDEYAGKHLGGETPVFDGFYFYSEPGSGTAESEETDFHKDTTIYINYTGKLLNGQVFDTTDERTAKDHNIYSASKDYAPVEVTMSSDSTEIKLGGNSIISGFASTLWRVSRPFEKCTGMFWSSLGYGTSGSGSTIPEYAPLVFEIELVENPDQEEEE